MALPQRSDAWSDRVNRAAVDAARDAAEADGAGPEHLDFIDGVFRGAAPEDIARYAPHELARLAEAMHDIGAERRDGEPLVRVFAPEETARWGGRESGLIAINEDKPFLVDSLIADLTAQGLRVLALFHPIIGVVRDGAGRRLGHGGKDARPESVIYVALDPVSDPERRAAITQSAARVFADVAVAVRDWKPIVLRLQETLAELKARPPRIPLGELEECLAFLGWLADNHFTFLGARDYAFDESGEGALSPLPETGLGLLADPEMRVWRRGPERAKLTPEIREFLTAPSPLIIAKSNTRSTVHRRVHMDYVGVKRFDAGGNLIGERRFLGLFTSTAYNRNPGEIPWLRRKIDAVIARAGVDPVSHDGKALRHILDAYPRDELIQTAEADLFDIALGILHLGERPQTRLFVRRDRFDRSVSALVYLPRDRYDTEARVKIGALLADAFDGHVAAFYPQAGDSTLARILYIIGRRMSEPPPVDHAALEAAIADAVRTFDDGLDQALVAAHGEAEGRALYRRYQGAFPAGYREAFSPDEAVADIAHLEAAAAGTGPAPNFSLRASRREHDRPDRLRLKLHHTGGFLALSDVLPTFENLGFRVDTELSYPVAIDGAREDGAEAGAYVHAYRMRRADGGPVEAERIAALEAAIVAVRMGAAEDDGLNALVMAAGLDWRRVAILRTIQRFLRQTGIAFSQELMQGALARNADVARLLIALFEARFDPAAAETMEAREAAQQEVRGAIDAALGDVQSADDDRILRRFCNVIEACLRTNAYQPLADGTPNPAIALKLNSRALDDLPAPRPLFEIFVYAPSVEGVHLRFGKVARGGIRWSDRREDFRTEVLGLVKAQKVKNAVIVPVGAKGGFFPKHLPERAARDAVQAAAIAAYRTFIGALLDVTDNLHNGTAVPPPHVVRHDDDDPYLVVAADKGTATFSDIANEIATTRGFWLGDAFASGGSAGYDHKKMGITARGAWEAVKRHFREIGRDIQAEPFTCIGVGDMSGDVFGNGMLLSQHTKLIAAFDHRHIFIDPDPDPAASWAERKRLFELPRSSWEDYDRDLISPGGGVFARSAKSIPLSDAMRAMTGLEGERASPQALMRALLSAECDLLWFGGIGTYVKASHQPHADAGDRANDALRVDGRDIRAKVIGEGANLGCTQQGRIEYARAGGRINTDAIDNSAGVDTSDHEVNIKILLRPAVERGDLDLAARNGLLSEMTDAVAGLVLTDNYDQTLALSLAEMAAPRDLDAHVRLMRDLERAGRLDRAVELLPDDEAIADLKREGHGLTRPELAVLLAYAKLALFDDVLESDLPEDPWCAGLLRRYFPGAAAERFAADLPGHPLAREIIATVVANQIVNDGGIAFAQRIREISGTDGAAAARGFLAAREVFGLDGFRDAVNALDGVVPASVQSELHGDAMPLLRRQTLWFVLHGQPRGDLGAMIAPMAEGVARLRPVLHEILTAADQDAAAARAETLRAAGVPDALAAEAALMPALAPATDIVMLARESGGPVETVAGVFAELGERLALDRLRFKARAMSVPDHWDRLAVTRAVDELYANQRRLSALALAHESDCLAEAETGLAPGRRLGAQFAWRVTRDLDRVRGFMDDLDRSGALSVAKLTLASAAVRELVIGVTG